MICKLQLLLILKTVYKCLQKGTTNSTNVSAIEAVYQYHVRSDDILSLRARRMYLLFARSLLLCFHFLNA